MNFKAIFLGLLTSALIFYIYLYFIQKREVVLVPYEPNTSVQIPQEVTLPEDTFKHKVNTFTNMLIQKDGLYSFFIKDLKNSKEYTYNANYLFNGASLYKLPIAVAILHKIQEEKLRLSDELVYMSDDFEGGSGILQNANYGSKYSVQQLLALSLKQSDNIASNILQRNLPEEDLNNAFSILELSKEFYLNNTVSAYQIGKYLETLILGNYLNEKNKQLLLDLMVGTSFDDRINSGLDKSYSFAHKIGSAPDTNSWHDCGYILKNDEIMYVVCLMSENATQNEYLQTAKSLGEIF